MSEKKRVLLAYGGDLLWPWEWLKDVAEVRPQIGKGKNKLTVNDLRDFKPHILAGMFRKVTDKRSITAELMDACENLEFIQLFNMGFDPVEIDEATKRGILVANLGGVGISSSSVSELAWAHVLSLARRIPQIDAAMRSGELLTDEGWRGNDEFYRGGPILSGKTLGLIGLGRIGKRSALTGRLGFNMKVIAYDPFIESADAELIGVQKVDLDTLLKESDVIIIHVAMSDESRHMIGEKEIAKMKKSVILVNDARGDLFDMPAIAKAIEEERIYGVGIDVWPKEPPDPNEPWMQTLLKSKRTSLSGHVGTQNEGMVYRHKGGLENVAMFCKGQRPQWVVNPAAFEVQKARR
jgi:phosphoglycerate dehydrogenase-like enzyme